MLDTVFHNGRIHTLDDEDRVYEAVGVSHGRITALGTEHELKFLIGPRNGTIEYGKRADFTVMAADPRDVPVEEVPGIPFTMTVVGGEIVWAA
ncbi:MAG: hypothetical protein JRF59_14285 [Deltaproteobacteria bacterium]|nr:hypothetical protein [Deltaproteobacteria bacterium]MBW1950825.1 hypothetical protein [Deltaproteobacteria bacterium]MBW2009930.1 hypothetical protein [Deltaproteobacteria bacterium]MBW2348984.1 hypothetical protein [Deltaproteobacteria bacterium]RLB32270.1 MAG: hypothetical protein DRH20_15055 [Deltaproteobacteria bacterium]